MITFLPFCFNPVESTQGELTDMAEIAFTCFSTPCPRCCLFQSRAGWTTHEVCNPEDEKNYSVCFLQLFRNCFRCALTILWHGYTIASGILLQSSLWVDNIRSTVFPSELLMFQETFPGMANSWPVLCSTFCLSSKPIKSLFLIWLPGILHLSSGWAEQTVGEWLMKQFQARGESNFRWTRVTA